MTGSSVAATSNLEHAGTIRLGDWGNSISRAPVMSLISVMACCKANGS